MRIGIIGPSEDEIVPFIKSMEVLSIEELAMLKFYSGTYNDIEVVAMYSGVGKVNAAVATQLLITKYNVTHVIVVGVAGALSNELKILDTVISLDVAHHDVADEILTEYHPFMESNYFKAMNEWIEVVRTFNDPSIYFGRIVTGESFIDQEGRFEIIQKHNALAVDMETASIAHVCYVNQIPFLAIRTITDTEEESGIEVFEKNCIDASNKSVEILKQLLMNIEVK